MPGISINMVCNVNKKLNYIPHLLYWDFQIEHRIVICLDVHRKVLSVMRCGGIRKPQKSFRRAHTSFHT